jgi:hypothetical protein
MLSTANADDDLIIDIKESALAIYAGASQSMDSLAEDEAAEWQPTKEEVEEAEAEAVESSASSAGPTTATPDPILELAVNDNDGSCPPLSAADNVCACVSGLWLKGRNCKACDSNS